MSRFKFRAWDKVTQKMFATGFHLIGEVMAFGVIEGYLAENPVGKTILERLRDVEVMQWTGLQDKNGKDIYEGDILRSAGTRGEDYVVVFDKGNYKSKSTTHNSIPKTTQERCRRQEVIGNIYETPELLKV